jgi:hypothetical protein
VVLSVVLSSQTVQAVELLGKDRMYIRFTNLRPDQAKIMIRLQITPNHMDPFGWDGKVLYIGSDGAASEPDETARYLAPFESSPWVDVGQYMNKQGQLSWATYLSPLLCGVMTEPATDGLFLLAEVAEGPGTRVIRRVEVKKPELPANPAERTFPWLHGYGIWNLKEPFLPTLGLLVPAQPELGPRVYTFEEALQTQLDVIATFPNWGRLPTQIVFKTTERPHPAAASTPLKQALGYNGYPANTVEGSLGDEIAIKLKMPADEQDRRFRQYLKEKKIEPLHVMSDANAAKARALPPDQQWPLVSLLPPMPDKPVQFYESASFRFQLWYEELAAQTKKFEDENPGKRVLCGANFAPHMDVWPDVRQWVDPFKVGAMTMTWTEDWWWQIFEVSPQVYGFLLDSLRLAGSYHDAPMQFYIMPFKGQSVDNFRRMHSLAFAHGVRIVDHFVVQNQALITWDYIDQTESPRMLQSIADMFRDAGAVEHRLYPAKPRKAKVAIMLSGAADTWDHEDKGGLGGHGGKQNANNEERKAIWLALRHAQYPVDLITDEDVAEGRLRDYRVLYLVGSEMLGSAVKPLDKWIRDGGILYATGGGGLLDEYRQPQPALLALYGLKSQALVRTHRWVQPRNFLPNMIPLDTVAVTGPAALGLLPMMAVSDVITAPGTPDPTPITVVPTGLGPGDHYRLAFRTSHLSTAESTDIADYNAFADGVANTIPELAALGTTWECIGSTATVDARDNVESLPGVPIYRVDDTKIFDDGPDIWDGSGAWGDQPLVPLNVEENGNSSGDFAWNGSFQDGTARNTGGGDVAGPLGGAPGLNPGVGDSGAVNWTWLGQVPGNGSMNPWYGTGHSFPIYVVSGELTVPVPEPSSIAFDFPVLCYREELTPAANTRVLATYKKDGKPALTMHPAGKGTVYYSGALAGLAYLTPAIVMPRTTEVLPTKFPADLRELILKPVKAAGIVPPVTTSDPLVEAQYLEGPNGAIVTLTNWRQRAIEKLVVRFPGQTVKVVRSLRTAGYFQGHLHEQQRGALPVQVIDGIPQVELTLAVTDYLLVD